METNTSDCTPGFCESGASGGHDFPLSEWSDGLGGGDPNIDFTDSGVCDPVAASERLVYPPQSAASNTKTVCMGLAMGLTVLASNKPRTFSWLLHESLAYVPLLILGFALASIAGYQLWHHRNPPNATRTALLLMASAAILAVTGTLDF